MKLFDLIPARFCLATTVIMLCQLHLLAVETNVTTAQELQNALTLFAANGADDTIHLTNGYYVGNFNFNSFEAKSLTLLGAANTDVTIDGAGGGRALNLSSTASGNTITVRGITFLRNCNSASIGALRIAAGSGATILVDGCRFLSPTNTSGMGLEIDSGLNVTVTNCIATGATNGSGGSGISISGVTGNVTVQNCVVTTNKTGRGLDVTGGSVVAIAGNTLSGNSAGGLNVSGASTVTVSGNNLTGNSIVTSSGGGAYCAATTVVISDNSFASNSTSSSGNGGGAYCFGTATLSNNTFTGNSSGNGTGGGGGGGVYCSGTATLSGNTFTSNSAAFSNGNGGGAFCSGGANGTVTLTENAFIGNSTTSSTGSGGGAYCTTPSGNCTVILSGNTAKQNTAGSGGGLYVLSSTVRLLNNLVVNNSQSSSNSKGGGVWVNARTNLAMINNTVFGNTAVGSGGGVAFQVDGVTEVLNVYNNIIWGNTATVDGADVHLAGIGSSKKFYFNDAHGMLGVWDITGNTVDVDPQFFDPVNGDYHLRGTSPLVNTGTNGAPSLPTTDLDGEPRVFNGTVDLGCYEFNNAALHPADLNSDWTISGAEFNAYAVAWKNGQTWSNAPTVIPADYLTRAGYLLTNGGTYTNDGSARPVNWKIGP